MNHRIFFVAMFVMLFPLVASAGDSEAIKLPYEAGQRFIVTQGYDTPPTHIKKDLDAIDFTQNGCDAYGKLAVAAADGNVMLAQESGYNGGYGTQVLVVNASRIVARYAHMIPGTIPASVAIGAAVLQGEPLGDIGNTGLTAGAACPVHPGTHIHFAMYGENSDGSFSAFLPEPISNYVGIMAGKWYLSDNALAIASVSSAVLSPPSSSEPTQPVAATIATTTIATTTSNVTSPSIATYSGGVTASLPSSVSSTATSSVPTSAPTSTPMVIATATPTATASFNSSTLTVDLSWPPAVSVSSTASTTVYQVFSLGTSGATSTLIATTSATTFSYPVAASDFGSSLQFEINSTIETALVAIPNWWNVIQPVADTNSNGSWYDDNWYDLGTGFYGDIRQLSFRGFVDDSDYGSSSLSLDEYLDPGYSQLNQSFLISAEAPFTDGLRTVTIGGLDIRLQPNKYYRLRTYQEYQNRSVILAGTSATGTAMYDQYLFDIGRVEYQYPFYPYLAAIMIPNYPPLMPPNPPSNMTITLDSLNSALGLSWSATTDPDTTSSLLTYQFNISSSTSLDASQWQSVGKNLSASAPVAFGNSYTIGIRAVDDFGNIGAPLIQSWNFPAGYTAPQQQLDHSVGLPGGAQSITFSATTTITGIAFWANGQYGGYCCSNSAVSIHQDASGTPGVVLATSETVRMGLSPNGYEWLYEFDSPQMLSPGLWWFSFDSVAPYWNGTSIYGSASDSYPGGEWFGSPGQDAYFRIQQATGP